MRIEVFNGDDYGDIPEVEACMRDWYALLDAGLRDHGDRQLRLAQDDVPRARRAAELRRASPTTIPHASTSAPSSTPSAAGRVIVSSGPFVRIGAGGAEIGDEIARRGRRRGARHVDAPPWVDVSKVELVRRGEVVATWHSKPGTSVVRTDETAHLPLRSGDWIIAIARGNKPMTWLHRYGALPFAFTNPIWVR